MSPSSLIPGRSASSRLPREIVQMIEEGALFVLNHSGGKDSQATAIAVRLAGVPVDQTIAIHADLGRVEWQGNVEHIRETLPDVPLIIARAGRTFIEMVEARGMFPSAAQRQCTSDLKRGPIERELRRYLKANPRFGGRIVNCMGMRAAESRARARRSPLAKSDRNSKAGRVWLDWLPIHAMTETQVFATIKLAGQTPHPVYAQGMSRLSCRFCIMASRADLTTAARLSPALYAEYVALERRLGHTLSPSRRTLEEITGIKAEMADAA